MKHRKNEVIARSLVLLLFFSFAAEISLLLRISSNERRIEAKYSEKTFNSASRWPPMKVYVYPNNSRHTSDCLYPPEMRNRYVNESGFWFQRMLEPTVHSQLLSSPIVTGNAGEADLFFVPHYSRMCSGLDKNGERWSEIPSLLGGERYFKRYSNVDHFIMHSVPNYGDKPADAAVSEAQAPMIGLLDFKWENMVKSPWTFAKSIVLPFITLVSNATLVQRRPISAFVAMSTSRLAKSSAELRKVIEKALKDVPGSEFIKISRLSPKSFSSALKSLPNKMGSSKFCIVPPGDAPSSKRLYDAVSHLCVPLLISDKFTLPFDGVNIDYESVFAQLPADNVSKLPGFIASFPPQRIEEMREKLLHVREMFTWDYKNPPKAGQALWSLAWALYDRVMMLKPYRNNEMTGDDDDAGSPFFWMH